MPAVEWWKWVEWPSGSGQAIIEQTTENHADWFARLGLPPCGLDFDTIYRGRVLVDHDERTIRLSQHFGQYTMDGRVPDRVREHFHALFPEYAVV